MLQQGDVHLCQTDNDGDITVVDGIIEMRDGIETTVYLALFGGNNNDSGGTSRQWWGNLSENEPAKRYTSETQYLLETIPPISSNRQRIEDAIRRDLQFLLTEGIATTIEVSATLPSINNILIDVQIDDERLSFTEDWSV